MMIYICLMNCGCQLYIVPCVYGVQLGYVGGWMYTTRGPRGRKGERQRQREKSKNKSKNQAQEEEEKREPKGEKKRGGGAGAKATAAINKKGGLR